MPSSASQRLIVPNFEIVARAFSPLCWQCHDPPSSYTNLKRQLPRSYFSPEHLAPASLYFVRKVSRRTFLLMFYLRSSLLRSLMPGSWVLRCWPQVNAMPDLLNYLLHSFCPKSNESHNWGWREEWHCLLWCLSWSVHTLPYFATTM